MYWKINRSNYLRLVREEPDLDAPESSTQQDRNKPEPVTPKKDTQSFWERIWNK
ncbi:hypothetical protein SAMN04487975_11779 [Planococcus glaciei]|nr:hypothetical protein SAMN04487975_11779 [Planococcus glaciei]